MFLYICQEYSIYIYCTCCNGQWDTLSVHELCAKMDAARHSCHHPCIHSLIIQGATVSSQPTQCSFQCRCLARLWPSHILKKWCISCTHSVWCTNPTWMHLTKGYQRIFAMYLQNPTGPVSFQSRGAATEPSHKGSAVRKCSAALSWQILVFLVAIRDKMSSEV
jgi:hypothetical protein